MCIQFSCVVICGNRGESFDSFKKYLRCSARMTVLHLKRFLLEKVGWSDAHQVCRFIVSYVCHSSSLTLSC